MQLYRSRAVPRDSTRDVGTVPRGDFDQSIREVVHPKYHSECGAGAEYGEIPVCLGDAMSAYTVVMGTLLLAPWALLGTMMVGTALSSVAAAKRRQGPVILPAISSIKRSSF
jgi:hypothetical protein